MMGKGESRFSKVLGGKEDDESLLMNNKKDVIQKLFCFVFHFIGINIPKRRRFLDSFC